MPPKLTIHAEPKSKHGHHHKVEIEGGFVGALATAAISALLPWLISKFTGSGFSRKSHRFHIKHGSNIMKDVPHFKQREIKEFLLKHAKGLMTGTGPVEQQGGSFDSFMKNISNVFQGHAKKDGKGISTGGDAATPVPTKGRGLMTGTGLMATDHPVYGDGSRRRRKKKT